MSNLLCLTAFSGFIHGVARVRVSLLLKLNSVSLYGFATHLPTVTCAVSTLAVVDNAALDDSVRSSGSVSVDGSSG